MTEPPQSLRIIAFPGAPNLPIFAALVQGFFAEEGLEVDVELTPSSVVQAQRTAAGAFDIALTAFDNVVAYMEGEGAAGADVDPGYVVVAGATQLELSLIVDPAVKSYEDLKGRSIALDALTTGFAFVLYEMLARAGLDHGTIDFVPVGATPQRWQSLKAGEHAGTLTIEPFTSIAANAGFKVLDKSSRLFGSYQGGVVAARRGFLAIRPKSVRALLRGYLKGLAWTLDPANGEAAKALLQERMPEIRPQAVEAVIRSLLSPRSGLTPGAAVLPEGMRTVLDLRSRHGPGGKRLSDPERYLDLSHLEAVTG